MGSDSIGEFLKALDEAVSREFKVFARHFVDPRTKLPCEWDLGLGVDIHVIGLKICVAREDPVSKFNRDNEQQVYRYRAESKPSMIVPIVINMAKTFLKENRRRLAIHEENMKAWRKELGALKIPKEIKVTRNFEAGTYSIEFNMSEGGCRPKVIKKAVRAAKSLLQAIR